MGDLLRHSIKLETRIKWLENGLKEIANGRDDMNAIYVKQQAQATLDGEPTTADEYNNEDDKYFTQKEIVYISNINKEIAKEWNRDREERINKENN